MSELVVFTKSAKPIAYKAGFALTSVGFFTNVHWLIISDQILKVGKGCSEAPLG